MIILINENEQVSLRIDTRIVAPLGICMSTDNNDIFVYEASLGRAKLKISAFSLAGCLLRKEFLYQGASAISQCTDFIMMPNGLLVTCVKKQNAVLMFDPLVV